MPAAFSFDSFLMDGASAGKIAWFAADVGIKATLGLLAALAVTWVARRSSAALRHRVWFLTYCGLLLLPVLPLVLPKWQIPLPAAFARIRPEVSQTLPAVPHESRPAEAPHQNHPESQPERDPVVSTSQDDLSWSADAGTARGAEQRRTSETTIAQSPAVTTPTLVAATQPTGSPIQAPGRSLRLYAGGLMAIWLAGAAVCLFGIVAGRRRGRQLLRSAEPVLDRRWLEPFEQLRENLRVTSRVALLESSQAVVPMATGILRHAVLLPRETEEWPTALRRYVLIHELAHVKRRDVLQHLISSVATALYWFHPLAWYGMRRMRLEREIASDDCVLMAGEHPCDYAAELVGIARRLHGIATPWAVCMAGGSTLEGRVRSMLDRARSHGPLSARTARSLLIAALAAIALLAAVEPGTSSVRQQAPSQTGVANVRSSDNHGLAKDMPRIVDRPDDKHILAEANEKSTQKAVLKDPTYSFAGTVVDQQGRPVAAAKISLIYFRSQALTTDPSVAVSDVHGRFEFTRKRSDLADLADEWLLSEMRVLGVKEGYGFASVPATACEKTGQLATAIHELKTPWASRIADKGSNVLTLVRDDLPIRGRLLSIDGRAVAGAKIAVVGVWASENGSLDAFEAKAKEGPVWRLSALFRGFAQAGTMVYQGAKRWYPGASIWNERRTSIVAVESDADGRFTITGLGRERLAELLITAQGVETTLKFVRTRRGPALPMGGPHSPISEEVQPSECSLVLGPSVPIEGRVVDAKTRQPLVGVRVQPTITVFSHALADAQGRYRIEGLPLGDNDLQIIPPRGSRYLPGGVSVNTTAGSPRAVRDIMLTAGILVHGQAIDERTHQPARGRVQYFAFEPNPLLEKTVSLRPNVTVTAVRTDSEGRFEIAALPGPGILGFDGSAEFPKGVGADRIQGQLLDPNSKFKEFRTVPQSCMPSNLNLVVPLNPRVEDREVTLDLKLRSGVDVSAHLVAFDGRPLSGESFIRGARPGGFWPYKDGDHFTVVGYFPMETRRLEVHHPARNLVGLYDLSGEPPAMITITLRPGASITGRVLDDEGLPVPYATIGYNGGWPATADAQGRFELKGIIPAQKYAATVMLRRREGNKPRAEQFDLFTDVTAKEGETKQLGDLRLKSREIKTTETRSGAPKKPNTGASEANEKSSQKAVSKDPTYSFAGAVVDQQGRPVVGAKISLSYFRAKPAAAESPVAVSDEHGRFEFSRKKSDFSDLYSDRYWHDIRVIAVKEGYGFASVAADNCERSGKLAAQGDELGFPPAWPAPAKGPNVLTLVADDLPIRGRLLTIDGRAVAGAKIAVVGVWAGEHGSLDAFEAKLKQGPALQHISGLFRGYGQAGAIQYQGNRRSYLSAAVSNERRPSIIVPVQSDSDGRFTITGLGRERMAEVLITASGLEATQKFVRTRRGPVLRMGGPDAPISEKIEPSECSLVLAPSVPIEGRVVDAKTRQPLAGVRVQPTSTVFAHTFTDAQGRYRMEGLPLGSNDFQIVPPRESRYLPGGVTVNTTAGSPRVVRDIALTAGILVHGQATDERTHQPVRGRVHYFAFEPNPLLGKTDSLCPFVTLGSVATDSEGRFEIAALPGPGILGFSGGPGFPSGVGADRIQGPLRDANGRFKEFRTVPQFCMPNNLNLVVPLNPRAADRDVALDFKLRSAAEIPIHLVAFDGRPLSGDCFVSGARPMGGFWPFKEGDHLTVVGYLRTQTRRLEVHHLAQNLVGLYDLSGDPPATITITLRPGASITGRVLDEEGLPVPYATIGYDGGWPATADAQGRFELKGIIPGLKYAARVMLRRREGNKPRAEMFDLFTDVTAKEGETKQLGDLRLKSREPKTSEKSSDTSSKPKTVTAETSREVPRDPKHAEPATDKAPLRLAGTVLMPNGGPAIGATVLLEGCLSQFKGGENRWKLVAEFSTDAGGTFDREFDGRWRPGDFASVRLSAIMPGYGRSTTVQPWAKDLRSIVLPLAGDEPIRARILNLEGRPIAGVRIDAVQVYPSKKEWIDRWLAAISPNAEFSGIGRGMDEKAGQMKGAATAALNFPAASIEMDPLAGLPSAVTDAEGKVELRGLGREGLVLLKIVGPGIAAAKVYALTRPMKAVEFNRGSQPVRQILPVYGSQFDYIAGPATVITGIVRDEETKKPIAGAIVASDALDGVRTASGGKLSATTDVEGRYRLEGLSGNRHITVTAMRPNSEYLPTDIEVGRPRAFEPVRGDITLERGVWAVGRVFNIKTGQSVPATLFYTPFRSNKFAQESRRSGTRGFLDYDPAGTTDDQGRFRIPILPGRGVVAVRAFGNYVPAYGASRSKELSNQKSEIATFDTLVPTWFEAVAEVDLRPKAAELRIDVPVDPGQDVVFKFVDRAGRPVSGARVHGMMPRRDGLTKSDTIMIPATSPDQTRLMWIDQEAADAPGHKPGGVCKFLYFKPIPGERERTITLDPPAVLTGRLVDPTGELPRVAIGSRYEINYNSVGQLSEGKTDAQGRFRYEIPGGGPFDVGLRFGGGLLPFARDLKIEPGEQIDFGELVVSKIDRFDWKVNAKHLPKRTRPPADDAAHGVEFLQESRRLK